MQRTEIVGRSKIDAMIELAFQIGDVQVFESYSEMDEEIIEIKNHQEYLAYFQNSIYRNKKHLAFGLYYKETKGFWQIRKIDLNPKYCEGKTYRYQVEGWGIISIQLQLKEEDVECRIAVNTERRAINWQNTHPELKSPNLWDWKEVESKVGKLIRELIKEN